MVLSYDSYAEVIQQQEAEKSKMERLEEEVAKLSAVFDKFT
jgi:hypothetical protein